MECGSCQPVRRRSRPRGHAVAQEPAAPWSWCVPQPSRPSPRDRTVSRETAPREWPRPAWWEASPRPRRSPAGRAPCRAPRVTARHRRAWGCGPTARPTRGRPWPAAAAWAMHRPGRARRVRRPPAARGSSRIPSGEASTTDRRARPAGLGGPVGSPPPRRPDPRRSRCRAN